MKLLIVEDNSGVRRIIKTAMAGIADEVNECADGAEALAFYNAHQPDFVLMDIAMKRVDGIAATRQITTVHPNAKVIIVTDYDQADLREAASSAGACGYFVKEDLLELARFIEARK